MEFGSEEKESFFFLFSIHLLILFIYLAVKVKVKSLSRVRLLSTPWTAAHQAPPSMGFSRQEYWSGVPFPSPGDLPNPGIEPGSHCRQMLYHLSHLCPVLIATRGIVCLCCGNAGSLVAAYELFTVADGIQFPDQGWIEAPALGSMES